MATKGKKEVKPSSLVRTGDLVFLKASKQIKAKSDALAGKDDLKKTQKLPISGNAAQKSTFFMSGDG